LKQKILNHYKTKVQDDSNDYRSQFNLGIIYKEMEMWKQAIEQFQITRKSNEHVLKSHNMLGICFAQQPPMISLAVKTLTKALELKGFEDKEYIDIHYNLGKLHEKLGKFDLAIEEYQQVLAIDSYYKDTAELLKNIKEKIKS
jgi:tetratricopeptide (TPR) repeat protein